MKFKASTLSVPAGAVIGLIIGLYLSPDNFGLLAGTVIGGLVGGFIGLRLSQQKRQNGSK